MSAPFRLLAEEPAENIRRFRAEIPPDSSLFAGHFPGRPILPGVAHLALVAAGLGRGLLGIRGLRLRRAVEPGEALDLLLRSPKEDGWTRFELRRGAEVVSQGTVDPGSGGEGETGGEGVGEARPAEAEADFPPVEALLPHGPPARLVTGVAAVADGEVVCHAEIPPLHPLAAGGRAPAFLALEAAAQAAAVLEAIGRGPSAGPRTGYLVGIREARLTTSFLPVGQPFRVSARLEGSAFPLSVYTVRAGEPGRETAAGTLSTFLLE